MKDELTAVAVVHRHADHIRWQQVAGELNPAKRQAQRHRDRVRQRRLADAGSVFDQQMAAGQKAGQALADLQILADDD